MNKYSIGAYYHKSCEFNIPASNGNLGFLHQNRPKTSTLSSQICSEWEIVI